MAAEMWLSPAHEILYRTYTADLHVLNMQSNLILANTVIILPVCYREWTITPTQLFTCGSLFSPGPSSSVHLEFSRYDSVSCLLDNSSKLDNSYLFSSLGCGTNCQLGIGFMKIFYNLFCLGFKSWKIGICHRYLGKIILILCFPYPTSVCFFSLYFLLVKNKIIGHNICKTWIWNIIWGERVLAYLSFSTSRTIHCLIHKK